MFVPSRRIQCQEYDRHYQADHEGLETNGFLPPVDDEYPEYIGV